MPTAAHPVSWSVHSTVQEPIEVLCAFVAHYLEMGASEIHLFLDQPTEEVVEALGKVDRVRLTLCNDAYWAASPGGGRPDRQVRRQVFNAKRAYAEAQHDWLLFVDADEFLYAPTGFARVLATIKRSTGFAKIGVAERAYAAEHPPQSLFDSRYFRRPLDPEAVDMSALYGDQARLIGRNVLGHARGKSVVRTGRPYEVRLHFLLDKQSTMDQRQQIKATAAAPELEGATLLHFDGLTPFHWSVKLLKRHPRFQLDGDNSIQRNGGRAKRRSLQVQEVFAARRDPERMLKLNRIQFIDSELEERLRQLGGLFDASLEIEAAALRVFTDLPLDFSVETFDERLQKQNSRLFARIAWPRPLLARAVFRALRRVRARFSRMKGA